VYFEHGPQHLHVFFSAADECQVKTNRRTGRAAAYRSAVLILLNCQLHVFHGSLMMRVAVQALAGSQEMPWGPVSLSPRTILAMFRRG